MFRAGAVHTTFHLTLTFPREMGLRCLHLTDGEMRPRDTRDLLSRPWGWKFHPKGGLAPTAQSL